MSSFRFRTLTLHLVDLVSLIAVTLASFSALAADFTVIGDTRPRFESERQYPS